MDRAYLTRPIFDAPLFYGNLGHFSYVVIASAYNLPQPADREIEVCSHVSRSTGLIEELQDCLYIRHRGLEFSEHATPQLSAL